jgi:hypothetical protein
MASTEETLGQTRVTPEDGTWTRDVADYILQRQNEDGGYAFAQGLESNAQDTYYALEILDLLEVNPPHTEQTTKWLREFPARDLYAYYYVTKATRLCREPVDGAIAERVLVLRHADGSFGTVNVDVEAPSEFVSPFMSTELLNMLGVTWDTGKTIDWLLRYQNRDGGFATNDRSNLRSTFHAVTSLRNLGYPIERLGPTLVFVRSCERPRGGFTVVPGNSVPYMEDVYYGVMTLDLLGERCKFPEQTIKHAFGCFNSNGGFRRSVELGISTFEDTYYALTVLRKLGRI